MKRKAIYYVTAGALRRFAKVGQAMILHANCNCPLCTNASDVVKITDLTGYNVRRCAYCFG